MTDNTEALPPLERAIDDYLDGYVLEGDDGYHLPTEHEKLIVKDAIMGLLEEPAFRAALAQRQHVPEGWQPIETAPRKDQMRALVAWPIDAGGHYVEEAWFDLARDQWWPANTDYTDSHGSPLYPSHWMPLPAAPAITAAPSAQRQQVPLTDEQIDGLRGLDTASRVRFYEHDFYVLSNFSAFNLRWKGNTFPTSEHAYHWEKFEPGTKDEHGLYVRDHILAAESAHAAFKMAEAWKPLRRPDWDSVKVDIMRNILRKKARQHEYVRRKLLATGDRELVEDSWRDDFWGWGPNRDGKNMLGKLWMQVRAELRELDQ